MIKVACIGDSITSGFTLLNPRRDSYPSLLQKMLGDGYEVRNFDIGLHCIDLKDVFNDSSYCIDGVHPQRKGTQMIAEYIFKERQRYDHTGIH